MKKNRINSSSKDIIYSLVIPCYNESKNLVNLVDRCKYLLDEKEDIEVVLVDNGSTDKSTEMLKDLLKNFEKERFRSVRVETNQGYGYGILVGLNECVGNILGWTHADLQADPADFLNAISIIKQSKDSNQVFIKGKRLGRPFTDVFFTWGMTIFERLILGVQLNDINAQPTVFSRDFFTSLQQPPIDFSIDLYFYYEAVKHNYNIKRFPVKFGLRLEGQGHNEKLISKLKYSWKTIIFSLGLRRHIKVN
jgi:glycosyltransferase involved in cell wall biosynthesis